MCITPSPTVTLGLTLDTQFEDTARALTDSAVQNMVNMIPSNVLQTPRLTIGELSQTAILSCDGSLLPSPPSGTLSSFWEPLPATNPHAHELFSIINTSAMSLLHSLSIPTKVWAWIFMPPSPPFPLTPGWILVDITSKTTRTYKPLPLNLFSLPSVDVLVTPLYIAKPKTHGKN